MMMQLLSDPGTLAAAFFTTFIAGLLLGMLRGRPSEPHTERDPKTGRYVKKR